MSPSCDLVVVGAGAAGLAAAIFALRRRSAARVLVVDGASKLGAKILVSGGGRCNVTNVEVGERDFNGAPRTFIRRVLKAFPAGRTRAFFEEIGVPLTEEPAGKLFPVSNRAGDVLRALLEEAAGRGTDIRSGVRVKGIRRTDRGFEITTNVDKIETRSVVLATGGLALPRSGSDGAGYDLARALGHTLVPPTPALVPLLLEGSFHRDLSGVTHDVGIEVRVGGRRYASTRGSMLWTHFGVSGPAVLDASRFWHRASLESSEVSVVANLLPGCDLAAAEARLAEAMGSSGARALRNVLSTLLPARLAGSVLAVLEIDPDTRAAHLSRTLRRQLLAAILEWPLPVVGSRGYDHAEATAGGIPLEEVDSATMESRICPGLHFAGEILDVDGRLGGFNFQWAWSSGFVGGSAAVAA